MTLRSFLGGREPSRPPADGWRLLRGPSSVPEAPVELLGMAGSLADARADLALPGTLRPLDVGTIEHGYEREDWFAGIDGGLCRLPHLLAVAASRSLRDGSEGGSSWAGGLGTDWRGAWATCPRGDWLLDLVDAVGVPARTRGLAALALAEAEFARGGPHPSEGPLRGALEALLAWRDEGEAPSAAVRSEILAHSRASEREAKEPEPPNEGASAMLARWKRQHRAAARMQEAQALDGVWRLATGVQDGTDSAGEVARWLVERARALAAGSETFQDAGAAEYAARLRLAEDVGRGMPLPVVLQAIWDRSTP